MERLAEILTREYGKGFSVSNLSDMRRVFKLFQILQALPAEFMSFSTLQAVSVESESIAVRQALPDELSSTKTPDKPPQKRQAPPAESKVPLLIDFRSHSHLGWTHYRILLGDQGQRGKIGDVYCFIIF